MDSDDETYDAHLGKSKKPLPKTYIPLSIAESISKNVAKGNQRGPQLQAQNQRQLSLNRVQRALRSFWGRTSDDGPNRRPDPDVERNIDRGADSENFELQMKSVDEYSKMGSNLTLESGDDVFARRRKSSSSSWQSVTGDEEEEHGKIGSKYQPLFVSCLAILFIIIALT